MKRQRSGASGTIVEMKLEVDIIPVSDVEAARDELVGRGVHASEVRHGPRFPRVCGSVDPAQVGYDGRVLIGRTFFSTTTPTKVERAPKKNWPSTVGAASNR
jgi:hypothetical protein